MLEILKKILERNREGHGVLYEVPSLISLPAASSLPQSYPPSAASSAEPYAEALERLCTHIQENSCDALFPLGGGSIQSMAKLANALISTGTPFGRPSDLPGTIKEPMLFHAAFLSDIQDGYEAGTSAILSELYYHEAHLAPDMIILDSRSFSGRSSAALRERTANTAYISLITNLEALRDTHRNDFIDYYAQASLKLIKQGITEISSVQGRKAIADAGVFASMIRGNIGFGPVSALAESFKTAGMAAKAESYSALLPHFLQDLMNKEDHMFRNIFTFTSEATHLSGTQESAYAEEGLRSVKELAAAVSSHIHIGKNRSVVEALAKLSLKHIFGNIQEDMLNLLFTLSEDTDVFSMSSSGSNSKQHPSQDSLQQDSLPENNLSDESLSRKKQPLTQTLQQREEKE